MKVSTPVTHIPLSGSHNAMDHFLLSRDRSRDNAAYYAMPIIGDFFRWRLKAAIGLLREPRVERLLDIGYGAGLLLDGLAARAGQLYGVDRHQYHDKVLRRARSRGYCLHLTRGDLLSLPFVAGSFDVVFCVSLLEHVVDIDHAVRELHRIIRPGGAAIVGFPPRSTLTAACFRLLGFDYRRLHPTGDKAILAALGRLFMVETVQRRPRHACLYVVARCLRKE